MKTMKSAMIYAPGKVGFEDIPIPEVGPGEILMKNISALTCGTDLKMYKTGIPQHETRGQVSNGA